ncbi:MAG: helix-hairpin-helix domain-containing protein [Christensenellaceae bacterium]
MQYFPVEVNKAGVEQLLRVPGIGAKGAYKIVTARKYAALTFEDLRKMRIVLKRARHFITCSGKFYGLEGPERVRTQLILAERSEGETAVSIRRRFQRPLSFARNGNACPSRLPERKAIFIKFLRRGRAFGLDGAIIKAQGRIERNGPSDEGRKEPNGFSNKRQR